MFKILAMIVVGGFIIGAVSFALLPAPLCYVVSAVVGFVYGAFVVGPLAIDRDWI